MILKSQRADHVCHFNLAGLEEYFSLVEAKIFKMNVLKTKTRLHKRHGIQVR